MNDAQSNNNVEFSVWCECGREYSTTFDESRICECGRSHYTDLEGRVHWGVVRGASGKLVSPEEAHLD